MASVVATRMPTNQRTARTLMSDSSCATSRLSRLPCGCAALVPGVLPMGEHLLEVRIVDRHERQATQLAGEQVEPDSRERDRNADVRERDREAALIEVRRDDPDQVDEAHRQEPPADFRERCRPALQIPRQQEAERNRELSDQEQDAEVLPAVAQA